MMQIMNSQCTIVQKPENLGTPIEQDFNHTLERGRNGYRYQIDRPNFWYHPGTGQVIMPDGTKGTIPGSTSLTTLLEKIEQFTVRKYGEKKPVNLYVVAGRLIKNRPNKEWFGVCREWTQKKLFWNRLQAEYRHNGFKVYLYGTGNFFGEEKNLDAMFDAFNTLEKKLERAFSVDGYPVLLSTPADAGRELIAVSLPHEKRYLKQHESILDLITHNFGQGRIETFEPQQDILENGVYVLDGRWMYASCVSHLPTGPCYRDNRNEFLGVYRKDGKLSRDAFPGFYSVTVQVPENWHHIGLIQAKRGRSLASESGYYPNTPGEVFTNWTTSAELANAFNHGWADYVHINERIFWPYQETDPLATWIKKLRDLREEVQDDQLLSGAIRFIVLHTLGSFHQFATIEPRFTARKDLPMKGKPYGQIIRKGEGYYWNEEVPLRGFNRQRFIRPEWSATVWGRARASLAEFALTIPFKDIVSLRTDSVWCSSLPLSGTPKWVTDDSKAKPGDFRVKDEMKEPFEWPIDGAKMRAIAIKRNLRQSDYVALQNELENNDLNELETEEE
jgi:hypothetical protein